MGFGEGVITLDSPTSCYFPGQTLSGTVKFSTNKIKKFRGIYVKLKGQAHVEWSETITKRNTQTNRDETETIYYRASEEYFNSKISHLVGPASGDYSLPAGDHNLPFQFTIPSKCPTSFEGSYGYVRYTIKATEDRAFKLDNHISRTFKVIAPLDLNTVPDADEPKALVVEKTFCGCFCSSQEFCETIVKLPVSGVVPGEVIPIEVNCNNKSEKEIDGIKISLIQGTKYYADYKPGTKSFRNKLTEVSVTRILPNSCKNVVLDFKIPKIEVINLAACRIIDRYYEIKVKVVPSGCHTNVSETEVIILGTIPLEATTAQYQITQVKSDLQNESNGNGIALAPYDPENPSKYSNSPYPDMNCRYPPAHVNMLNLSSIRPEQPIQMMPGASAPPFTECNPVSPYQEENPLYPSGNSPYPTGPVPGTIVHYPVVGNPYPGGNNAYASANTGPRFSMPMPTFDQNEMPPMLAKYETAHEEAIMPLLPKLPAACVTVMNPSGAFAPTAPALLADDESAALGQEKQAPFNPECVENAESNLSKLVFITT